MLMNYKIIILYDFEAFLYDYAIQISNVGVIWLLRKLKIVQI